MPSHREIMESKKEIEFLIESQGSCHGCDEKSELNGFNNCVDCWHEAINANGDWPFKCKTKGVWKAFKSRDDMPLPPGNW